MSEVRSDTAAAMQDRAVEPMQQCLRIQGSVPDSLHVPACDAYQMHLRRTHLTS